jgi:hypothetical protein
MDQFQVGDGIWVPHPEDAWVAATITNRNAEAIWVKTLSGKEMKVNKKEFPQLEKCGRHLQMDVENLVDLEELSEGAILHHVRKRYLSDKVRDPHLTFPPIVWLVELVVLVRKPCPAIYICISTFPPLTLFPLPLPLLLSHYHCHCHYHYHYYPQDLHTRWSHPRGGEPLPAPPYLRPRRNGP